MSDPTKPPIDARKLSSADYAKAKRALLATKAAPAPIKLLADRPPDQTIDVRGISADEYAKAKRAAMKRTK